jgi:hypothetical protein
MRKHCRHKRGAIARVEAYRVLSSRSLFAAGQPLLVEGLCEERDRRTFRLGDQGVEVRFYRFFMDRRYSRQVQGICACGFCCVSAQHRQESSSLGDDGIIDVINPHPHKIVVVVDETGCSHEHINGSIDRLLLFIWLYSKFRQYLVNGADDIHTAAVFESLRKLPHFKCNCIFCRLRVPFGLKMSSLPAFK